MVQALLFLLVCSYISNHAIVKVVKDQLAGKLDPEYEHPFEDSYGNLEELVN
jgi:hypothetical protein